MGMKPSASAGWYNKARSETADGTQKIEGCAEIFQVWAILRPDDAVAYAIYSARSGSLFRLFYGRYRDFWMSPRAQTFEL